MQIDIDFEVFKVLTGLRVSESDSYNAVIRRLLDMPNANALSALLDGSTPKAVVGGVNALAKVGSQGGRRGLFGSSPPRNALALDETSGGLLANYVGGIWFGNVHFPEGTKFRATYKGQTYSAEITKGQWVGADGRVRRSPSDAASAISNTNVNGWRFWYVQMPGDPSWRKLDELKQ
jgi:hypothetical protein